MSIGYLGSQDNVPFKDENEVNVFRKEKKIRIWGQDLPWPFKTFDMLFEQYGFQRYIQKNLKECGFSVPTPIQMQAIPVSVHKRDLIACAPTGSGKTLAFILSILHDVHTAEKKGFRALIVSPTRELATQIYNHLKNLSAKHKLKTCLLTKANAALQAHDVSVRKKFDILVTTPLRLVHAIEQKEIDLSMVRHLVLDEADRLLELGFVEQVDEILAACTNSSIQISLYSATMPSSVEQLATTIMKDPVRVTIGAKNAAIDTIDQKLVYVGQEDGKLIEIRNTIQAGFKPPCLIFVQSIERAKELFHELVYDGMNVDVIHAERTQAQRDRIIENFKAGKLWILIATELMARGIDFKGVNLVINYDFPQSVQSYIHRIGRTGRAGRPGKAVTYFTKDDGPYLKIIANVMRESGCDVPDWMLDLRKPSKKMKQQLKKKPVDRKTISTMSSYDKRKLQHKSPQQMLIPPHGNSNINSGNNNGVGGGGSNSGTPSTPSQTFPPLFNLPNIDPVEPWQMTMVDCYHMVVSFTSGKSSMELHDSLHQKASQSMEEHHKLVDGLLYAVLTSPANASIHLGHLHHIVRDGFERLVGQLKSLCVSIRFRHLKREVLKQLFWLLEELARNGIFGIEQIVIILTRQIRSGDVSTPNIRLCQHLLDFLISHMNLLYSRQVAIATCFYTYARVVLDHSKFPELRDKECRFIAKLLREKFNECMPIGRDMIRILQDISALPEICDIWQAILTNPTSLSPQFTGIEQILKMPTPPGYLVNRIPFELEVKLRFMLENLKWNSYTRNFEWLVLKYLRTPESDSLCCDIIRYICGAFHPSNRLLASEMVPRYILIGAIFRTIRSPTTASNAKLALFYDWFFFNSECKDNIMNIEPAILLMERSIEKYPYLTCMLMEFLMLETEVYHPPIVDMMREGVLTAMKKVVSSGVIRSLSPIYTIPTLNPVVKRQMYRLFNPLLSSPTGTSQGLDADDNTSLSTADDHSSASIESAVSSGISSLSSNEFCSLPGLRSLSVSTGAEDVKPEVSDIQNDPESLGTVAEDPNQTLMGNDNGFGAGGNDEPDDEYLGTGGEDSPSFGDNYEERQSGLSFQGVDEYDQLGNQESADQMDVESERPQLDKSVLEAEGLYLFGQLPMQLYNAMAENDAPNIKTRLKEIIHIFSQSEASSKAVGDVLAFTLSNSNTEDIESIYEIRGSSTICQTSQQDYFSELFTYIVNEDSKSKSLNPRSLELLNNVYEYLPWVGYRWLLFSVVDRNDPSIYQAFSTVNNPEDFSSRLSGDLHQLQDISASLYYNLFPSLIRHYPKAAIANSKLIYTAISMIDSVHVFRLCGKLALGHASLFGEYSEKVVMDSLDWESYEQSCLWKLITAELSGNKDAVENLINSLLLQHRLDPASYPEVFNGLVSLLLAVGPTLSIVSLLVSMRPKDEESLGSLSSETEDVATTDECYDLATQIFVMWFNTRDIKSLEMLLRNIMDDGISSSDQDESLGSETAKISKQGIIEFLDRIKKTVKKISPVEKTIEMLQNRLQSPLPKEESEMVVETKPTANATPTTFRDALNILPKMKRASSTISEPKGNNNNDTLEPPKKTAKSLNNYQSSSAGLKKTSNGSRTKRRRNIVESDDSEDE
ncbi:RNA-dependent ATPase rok1 [Mycoemilia scoparia]|uniref:RNA helicase n=1 Tax=Mycoemilia scoparia TaxID=417184 RepID=A0A9W7ZY78_9FUNG|nr:RNA-dependent ATPase rok1 [Mycoemilia scoparia]